MVAYYDKENLIKYYCKLYVLGTCFQKGYIFLTRIYFRIKYISLF